MVPGELRAPGGQRRAARGAQHRHRRRRAATYVLPLDADNLLYPSGLTTLLDAPGGRPGDVVATYGILERFDETGSVGVTSHLPWDVDLLVQGAFIDAMALFRRSRWSRSAATRIPPAVGGWEDYDLWLRAAEHGRRAELVPAIVGRYREHAGSMRRISDIDMHGELRHPPRTTPEVAMAELNPTPSDPRLRGAHRRTGGAASKPAPRRSSASPPSWPSTRARPRRSPPPGWPPPNAASPSWRRRSCSATASCRVGPTGGCAVADHRPCARRRAGAPACQRREPSRPSCAGPAGRRSPSSTPARPIRHPARFVTDDSLGTSDRHPVTTRSAP